MFQVTSSHLLSHTGGHSHTPVQPHYPPTPQEWLSPGPESGLCMTKPHSSDLYSIYFAAATSHPRRGWPGVWLRQSLDRWCVPGGSVHLLATHLLACSHWLHGGDASR